LSSKKLNMKNNTQGNINNNVYSTTTLSTGNNGNINAEEKRTFKFNKKKWNPIIFIFINITFFN